VLVAIAVVAVASVVPQTLDLFWGWNEIIAADRCREASESVHLATSGGTRSTRPAGTLV